MHPAAIRVAPAEMTAHDERTREPMTQSADPAAAITHERWIAPLGASRRDCHQVETISRMHRSRQASVLRGLAQVSRLRAQTAMIA
jgi:hypothetical protein